MEFIEKERMGDFGMSSDRCSGMPFGKAISNRGRSGDCDIDRYDHCAVLERKRKSSKRN